VIPITALAGDMKCQVYFGISLFSYHS
jgi:hypothetical protein